MAFHPLYIKHQIFSSATEFSFCYRSHSWSSLCQSWWPGFSYSSSFPCLPHSSAVVLKPLGLNHTFTGVTALGRLRAAALGLRCSQTSLPRSSRNGSFWSFSSQLKCHHLWGFPDDLLYKSHPVILHSPVSGHCGLFINSWCVSGCCFSVFPTTDRPSQFNESGNSLCSDCHSLCVQWTVGHSVSIYGIHKSISNSLPAKQT